MMGIFTFVVFRIYRAMQWLAGSGLVMLCLLISGCASYGNISNKQKQRYDRHATAGPVFDSSRPDQFVMVSSTVGSNADGLIGLFRSDKIFAMFWLSRVSATLPRNLMRIGN